MGPGSGDVRACGSGLSHGTWPKASGALRTASGSADGAAGCANMASSGASSGSHAASCPSRAAIAESYTGATFLRRTSSRKSSTATRERLVPAVCPVLACATWALSGEPCMPELLLTDECGECESLDGEQVKLGVFSMRDGGDKLCGRRG